MILYSFPRMIPGFRPEQIYFASVKACDVLEGSIRHHDLGWGGGAACCPTYMETVFTRPKNLLPVSQMYRNVERLLSLGLRF